MHLAQQFPTVLCPLSHCPSLSPLNFAAQARRGRSQSRCIAVVVDVVAIAVTVAMVIAAVTVFAIVARGECCQRKVVGGVSCWLWSESCVMKRLCNVPDMVQYEYCFTNFFL